jgi:hypothetical protein
VGVFFVEHTTSITPAGVSEEFVGSADPDQAAELKYEKSARELYILIHNHVLSLSVLFFVLGGVFYFSSLVSEGVKRFLLVEPFLAILTTFGGIALVRFVAEEFSWLVLLSGISLFSCYATMAVLILVELWIPHREGIRG